MYKDSLCFDLLRFDKGMMNQGLPSMKPVFAIITLYHKLSVIIRFSTETKQRIGHDTNRCLYTKKFGLYTKLFIIPLYHESAIVWSLRRCLRIKRVRTKLIFIISTRVLIHQRFQLKFCHFTRFASIKKK